MHQWLDTILELYVCIILTVEYLWGRSDMDIKNEAKKKKQARQKYQFDVLNQGEGR